MQERHEAVAATSDTSLAGVVHQQDLEQQMSGGAVNDAVDRPQQRAPGLVVEHDNDAGVGQLIWVNLGLAAVGNAFPWMLCSALENLPSHSADKAISVNQQESRRVGGVQFK